MQKKRAWVAATFAALISIEAQGTELSTVDAIEAPPFLDQGGIQGHADYVAAGQSDPWPKAFALSPKGNWAWVCCQFRSLDAARELAIDMCDKSAEDGYCRIYAINDRVIWTPQPGDERLAASKHRPLLSAAATSARTELGISVGDRFPNLTFKDAQGRDMSLEDFRGDIILVHFFATWCSACQSELYELNELFEALKGEKRIKFVVLNYRDSFGRCAQYARQVGYTLPVYDSGQQSRAANLGDGITRRLALPTSFVLDPNGVILISKFGTLNWSKFEEPLRSAARSLAESRS